MPNKKTVKRSRGRSRKGGFFGLFDDKHNTGNAACDPNNLVNLKDSNSMHANYQTCCPKTWYGRKNNSPYCKQLDLNYKSAFQGRQNEANFNKQAINSTFTSDSDNGITVDAAIDCKSPNLYNTKEEMEKYVETCECNKTRWNPFSNKKANCAIIKPKLEKAKQQKEEDDRNTLVTNPYKNIQPQVQPQEVQNQRPSVYAADDAADDDIPPPPVNTPPEGDWKENNDYDQEPGDINTEGGKRRKTKKHFKKRSIRKRSIRKRSIRKRSIMKRSIRKRSIRKRKGRKH